MTDTGHPDPGGRGVVIFLLIIMLLMLPISAFGLLLTPILFDGPWHSFPQEIGRWTTAIPIWLSPILLGMGIFEAIQQIRGKRPIDFLRLIKWPVLASGLAAAGFIVGMILWNM